MIEIRQLIIRASAEPRREAAVAKGARAGGAGVGVGVGVGVDEDKDAALIAACVREVLRELERASRR